MELKRDTLVIMCSGPQDMNKVFNFIQNDLELGKPGITFDLLSVPGDIHSLNNANSILFIEYLKALNGWITFLVEKHNIKRIIIIDHSDCAWFKRIAEIKINKHTLKEGLTEQSKQFIKTSTALKYNVSVCVYEVAVEIYEMNILENDEIKFEKIEI